MLLDIIQKVTTNRYKELRTGIVCKNDLSNRRKLKTEEKYPKLLNDIREIMEPECQADPQLRTAWAYTNMTAADVREALLAKGWTKENIPSITFNGKLEYAKYLSG